MRTGIVLLLGLAAAVMPAGAPAGELQPYESGYIIIWKGMTAGVVKLKLSRSDASHWTYESVTEPRGLFRMVTDAVRVRSDMELTADGIRPLHFLGDAGNTKEQRDIELAFDWQKGRVAGVIAGKPVDEELTPGMQDDLSVQVAVALQLDNGHTPASFKTIGDGGTREFNYTRDGSEKLRTAIGTIDTIIYRAHRTGSPRSTRYWCAPSLGFLPLRAEQRRLDEVQWTTEIASLKR
jgi:hypothetical protein